MRGLRTARVLVLDDDPAEAEPLLRGLGKLGIGSLYFNGEVEDLPDQPFQGVRLVFLDLRLGAGLTDATHAVGQTVTVLKKLVRAAKGETAVVLWTKHGEDEPVFMKALADHFPGFEPAFSMRLQDKIRFVRQEPELLAKLVAKADEIRGEMKPSFSEAAPLRGDGEAAQLGTTATAAAVTSESAGLVPLGVDELRDRISDALTDDGYRLLWEWEQSIHDAASATVEMLLRMRAQKPIPLMSVLAKLAHAPGQKIVDSHTALSSLFEGLNPVHADYVRRFAGQGATGQHVEALLKRVESGKLDALPQSELAVLNRFMLADGGSTGSPYPGDVFLAKEWVGTFPGDQAAIKKHLLEELFKQSKTDDPRFADANVELCLTEITAACDFAQAKAHNARLIFGLLVKAVGAGKELSVPEHCRTFAREVEFIRIEESARGLEGNFRLMMNARWIHSCPVSDLAKQRSIIRLRDQVITDVRAWFASHASRPGYVSVR